MTFDIGRVVSTCFAIMKDRVGQLIALWAIFFGISLVFSLVGTLVLGASIAGAGGLAASDFDNPLALGGAGIIAFVSMAAFYIIYFAIGFGQQASMTVMSSPVEKPLFADAMVIGLKAGLTYVVLTVLIGFAMIIAVLLGSLATVLTTMLGSVATLLAVVIMLPIGVYLFCRFAVLMPVVAVERVFNPFKALNRTWTVTRGNVFGIFLVSLISLAVGLLLLLVPILLFLSAGLDVADGPADFTTNPAATGVIVVAVLLAFPLYVVWQIFSTALNASLHAAISDDHSEKMSEVFE